MQNFLKQVPVVAVALDVPTIEEAMDIVHRIKREGIVIKIGLQLFIKYGREIVCRVRDSGHRIFLDLKIYDIPNTVQNAVKSAVELGVDYLTVHASGGSKMLKAAIEGAKESNLKILAVTALTSFSEDNFRTMWGEIDINRYVEKLTETAFASGVKGVVCSIKEVSMIREKYGKDIFIVTPGIRIENIEGDDQQRIGTPADAVRYGVDMIVVGRHIVKAKEPESVLARILDEMEKYYLGGMYDT